MKTTPPQFTKAHWDWLEEQCVHNEKYTNRNLKVISIFKKYYQQQSKHNQRFGCNCKIIK